MLDVIHVIFEDDHTNIQSGEHIEAKQKVRKIVYKEYYNRIPEYSAGNLRDNIPEKIANDGFFGEAMEEEITPFDPKNAPAKPYMAPTPVDSASSKPFGKNIDAPLG